MRRLAFLLVSGTCACDAVGTFETVADSRPRPADVSVAPADTPTAPADTRPPSVPADFSAPDAVPGVEDARTDAPRIEDRGAFDDAFIDRRDPRDAPSDQAAPFDPCAVTPMEVEMVWSSCAPEVDCVERPDAEGVLRRYLHTPTSGRVALEAHLVTVEDDFGGGWPGTFTEGLEAHYALSFATSNYVMDRTEPWAPAGEGGSMFGQSAFSRPLPVLDEAFYVNMYWRRRPAPGTRMLIGNPRNGRTIVGAGGYETGPGDPRFIGGVTEEIHHYLGTGHGDALSFAFLVDPSLPLGPVTCGP